MFVKGNGIRHVTSPPCYPAASSLVERFLLTFRQVISAMTPAKGDLLHRIAPILLDYGMLAKPLWIRYQQFSLTDIMKGFVQTYSEENELCEMWMIVWTSGYSTAKVLVRND